MVIRLTRLSAVPTISAFPGRCAARLFLWALLALTGAAPAADLMAPFTLRQNSNDWWMVAPDGRKFFSLGICMVTPGVSREAFDPENPAYAFWQAYPTETAWADGTLDRLQRWGFTTVGAWSDTPRLRASTNMLRGLTPVLHLGSTVGAPWWDMWDEKIIQRMDDVAREQILAVRDDPHLIGYYTDNEMGWWNATLFHMALEQSAASGQRQRLLKLLREAYADDWSKLCGDFEPEFAASWSELEQRGQLWLRPGTDGIRVMRRFLAVVADRYYQITHDLIRKYDQRALILGDRYQSFYYPEVARAAAPYVDAISSNLNANWNDGTFVRFYLDTMNALTRKPIIISEFYMAAMQNRTGNRNNHGVFPLVETQKERAAGAIATLRQLARSPYVVGADWFQYYDEPRHGREDGENYNFGLVDIEDRIYETLTTALKSLKLDDIKSRPHPPRATATNGIPSAPSDPFADYTSREILRGWDRERGFVPCATEFPMSDLYICWNSKAIYLGIHSYDVVEDAYYRNKSVPKIDRALWSVNVEGASIQARIGAEREPMVNDTEVRIEGQSGLNLNVHTIAIMEIPAKRFGKKRFERGDTIHLDTALTTHGRAYRYEWKGDFQLAR